MILALVSFLTCAGTNCFAVIGAILCFLAMQAADHGDAADAESKLKWGKIVTVSGGALSLVLLLSGLTVSLIQFVLRLVT
jgi:hypothetical protein